MSAGFTPGPWVVEDPFDFELSVVANGDQAPGDWTFIAGCKLPDEDDHNITGREAHANARLIAAAPELYEALERVERELTLSDDNATAGLLGAVHIALAKARGEQVSA